MGLIRKAVLIGAGYVLGARAGTQRYDEIVRSARALADRPEVQSYLSVLREKTGLTRPVSDVVVVVPPLPDPVTAVPPPSSSGALVTPPLVQADLASPVDPASVRRPSGGSRP